MNRCMPFEYESVHRMTYAASMHRITPIFSFLRNVHRIPLLVPEKPKNLSRRAVLFRGCGRFDVFELSEGGFKID